MITIYKGYHSDELFELIRQAWLGERTLIMCPPIMQNFSFQEKLKDVAWPSKPVFGVFTSGTSAGVPRLVLYSKENILASINAITKLFDHNRMGEIFCYPQPTHTFGLLLGYALSLHLDIPLKFASGKYSRRAHELRASLTNPNLFTLGTPTHFRDLLSYLHETNKTLAPSYSCIAGGSPVSRSLWMELKNTLNIAEPSIGYGCTEAAPGITHLAPGIVPESDNEIGTPLSSLNIDVTQDGVKIHGASLAMAILTDSGITFPQSLLIRDELKEIRPDHYQYQGRLDFVLNRGGEKFYLESIENILRENLKIEAIALALSDARLNENLGLLIETPKNQTAFDAQKMCETINSTVADHFGFKIPVENIKFTNKLPTNASSKYDRIGAKKIFSDVEKSLDSFHKSHQGNPCL